MNNVVRHNFSRKPFVVNVVYDGECGMWVASCDALHVATEAASYEAVTARFWVKRVASPFFFFLKNQTI